MTNNSGHGLRHKGTTGAFIFFDGAQNEGKKMARWNME